MKEKKTKGKEKEKKKNEKNKIKGKKTWQPKKGAKMK